MTINTIYYSGLEKVNENQKIEYKLSWRDEFLEWICGFANAQGGILYIGIDDLGRIKGVKGYTKLMEEIPNKIKNYLGIVPEVNLLERNRLFYLEIKIEPQSVAISFKGRYYIRMGSTNNSLSGNALTEFLLKKGGRTWDDVIEERASINDIDESSVRKLLISGEKSGRLPDTKDLNLFEILDKLRLVEGDKLKRAAIILFGHDPNRFYPNVMIQIGRFQDDDVDLLFQEVEEGNMVKLIDTVLLQLNNKFLIKKIDFEGVHRVERGEYPVAAIREMLLNALVHRDYMGAKIQIRVYNNMIKIWNEGKLPESLTSELLKKTHPSILRNPVIADVCFKGGYIDTWGRGTLKIYSSCRDAGLPEPQIIEEFGGVSVTVFKDTLNEQNLMRLGISKQQIEIVLFIKKIGSASNKELQELLNLSDRTILREIKPLVEREILEKVGITGRNTKYILKGTKPDINPT